MSSVLHLGLTTVGDLLLENQITYFDSMEQSKGQIELCIPPYQRDYKWTTRNVDQLFDDLTDAMDNHLDQYRIGTLILHQENKDGRFVYNIVDGQQRIISLSLLFLCLNPEIDFVFLHQNMQENSKEHLINNYRSLKLRVNQFGDFKDNFFDYIQNKCQLIVVVTDDISEAFQFFDSQNARGKALYPHDLLKAYHLREMRDLDKRQTEEIVRMWEDLDQDTLSRLFKEYLYRIKEWLNNKPSYSLNESNIDIFKGISSSDKYPYSIFYKSSYAFTSDFNNSQLPATIGYPPVRSFQLNTPIIAGKPFFEYSKHYFYLLEDIKNTDGYEGVLLNNNEIINVLDQKDLKKGKFEIPRLMFDCAILLYVDRFCHPLPTKEELDMLDRFVLFAFLWSYSLRAQYEHLGWDSAKNYIVGKSDKTNAFNLYIEIASSDSPSVLMSRLSSIIKPLSKKKLSQSDKKHLDTGFVDNPTHYLVLFDKNHYLEA